MEYGTHVDDPIMKGNRTDLSFTLFLSETDSYEGGGLVMEDALEERVIPAGAGRPGALPDQRPAPGGAGDRRHAAWPWSAG